MAGVVSSFDVAEVALAVVGEIDVSARQINKLTVEVGGQLASDRDERTRQYVEQPLPRQATEVDVPPDLAGVFCDGGRMRTREENHGPGVHGPHWREMKNAAFHRMQSQSFEEDPQIELPECFQNEAYVEKMVKGLKSLKKEGREQETASEPDSNATVESASRSPEPSPAWQPETMFRTCISSLASSEKFGAMMAAEADRRGFYVAKKQAFLADGLAYNWTIQQRWFPKFVPVADFVHVVEYLYTAAKAVHPDEIARWQQYLDWTTACWQGRVDEVIEELHGWQSHLGPPAEGEEASDSDPRTILRSTITYFSNNRIRMDYPRYRREGLPVTSSLAESLVKQIHKRVKGTEKFFNDGRSGEAILQLRAAILCDDARLDNWIRTRPISPFSPRCRTAPQTVSA